MAKAFVPASMYERAFRHASAGSVLTALDGSILDANDAACVLLGREREELLTRELASFAHPDERDRQRAILRCIASGTLPAARLEQRHRHGLGDDVPVSMSVVLGRDERGRPDCLLVALETLHPDRLAEDHAHRLIAPAKPPASDPSELAQKRSAVAANTPSRQALIMHDTIIGSAIEGMVDIVVVVDRSGQIIMMSETAKTLFGELEHEGLPHDWGADFGVFFRDQVSRCPLESYPVLRALRGEIVEQEELWVRLPTWSEGRWHSVTGTPIRDDQGALIGAVSIGRDITQQKANERKMQQAALRDELTGLYNRRGFWAVGEPQLRAAEQHGRSLALLLVRVADDLVKPVDDPFQRRNAEDRMIESSLILQHCCEPSDLVARIRDGAFAVLTENDDRVLECLVDEMLACAADRGYADDALGLRFGWARRDPAQPGALSDLLARAEDAANARPERSAQRRAAGRSSEWRSCPSARPQAFTRRL